MKTQGEYGLERDAMDYMRKHGKDTMKYSACEHQALVVPERGRVSSNDVSPSSYEDY